MSDIVGLLLAAGSAKRFGSNKLLHLLPHDVPIAVQSLRHLKLICERVVAVVRPDAQGLSEKLKHEGCEVVVCDRADLGMGESLACGVRTIGNAGGCLVALADMPFIRPSSIEAVRDALAKGALLVAPYFRARRGHPVGVAGRFFSEMRALSGDEGARKILEGHKNELIKVPVGDPGVIRDIDRPEDLTPPLVV